MCSDFVEFERGSSVVSRPTLTCRMARLLEKVDLEAVKELPKPRAYMPPPHSPVSSENSQRVAEIFPPLYANAPPPRAASACDNLQSYIDMSPPYADMSSPPEQLV